MFVVRSDFRWLLAGLALALLMSCGDDEPEESVDADTTLTDLSSAEIEEICSSVEAMGAVDCEGEMIDDSFDEAACVETTQRLQNDLGCYPARRYVAEFVEVNACERREFEPVCPGEDLCETYTIEECETLGEGICQVRMGRRYDTEQECLVDEPAYCIPRLSGCDTAIDELEAPDGSCWQFGSICPSPSDWTSSANCSQLTQAATPCP